MKNSIKLFGIIAIAAVIGFSMAACDLIMGETIGHTHNWVWTVTDASAYPAMSIQICKGCGETTGSARAAAALDKGPAGGIIYYVNAAGFKLYQGTVALTRDANADGDTYTIVHYLEAAPASEPKRLIWSFLNPPAKGAAIQTVKVLLIMQNYSSGDNKWLGYGLRNTRLAVAAMAGLETGRAPQVCAAKTTGGYNDWFLPSIDELELMYVDTNTTNALGINKSVYGIWSSSEREHMTGFVDGTSANMRSITGRDFYGKYVDWYVRAVRAF